MDMVTLGAALNGSAEYVKSHFKGGANIQIVDNSDGTQTINASGEVSSEDTVARNAIADIKDGENLDSFADVETALATKVDKVSGKGLSTNDFTTAEKTKLDDLVEIKSIGTGLSLNSGTGELTATGGGGGGTSDYTHLTNKPEINGTTLTGNKSSSDLGLQDKVLGSWTAGTATTHSTPASTDTVLQALQKIDNNQRNDETNISNIQAKTKAMSEGGDDYIVINGVRLYVGATEPTGTIPEGSLWLNSAVINQ